ncbi:histidine phosphatase family protein [Actinocatenispora thailandica]|nr:histidine phosphatase family protein [Actinocatenispora thailandica]
MMCAARVLCLVGGEAAALAPYRPVRLYVAPDGPRLAGAVDAPVEERAGLAGPGLAPRDRWLLAGELAAPAAGGESGQQVVDRFAGTLAEIADRHRGQTVAVLADGLELPLAALCAGLSPARVHAAPLAPGDVVVVEYDADGWRYLSGWPA